MLTVADERIARIHDSMNGLDWVRYPRAEAILAKLEDLYSLPRYHRMPHMLIVGDTNNGKTMIAERFFANHLPCNELNVHDAQHHVIKIQAPPTPDEGRFYNIILESIYAPVRMSARNDQRQLQVQRFLDVVGTKVLIIDEIQHLLAGSVSKQRQLLNVLKYLGNELRMSIVALGTRDAFNVLQTDPQIANRFEPAVLPRWQLNAEYLRLLAAIEPLLLLRKPSSLTSAAIATKILALSEGTIGEICRLTEKAAIYAIESGDEEVTDVVLDSCGYSSPSLRRNQRDG